MMFPDGIKKGEMNMDEKLQQLQEERRRFLTIAYNAICLGGLDEIYDKDRLIAELGCSEEEYDEIMEV